MPRTRGSARTSSPPSRHPTAQIVGARERWLARGWTSVTSRAVTWCDGLSRLTVGFSSSAGAPAGPASGLSPYPGGARWPPRPRPLLSSRTHARLQQHGAAGISRIPRGYSGLTREAYALDLRHSPAGASSTSSACSRSAAPTSNSSPASWKPGPGPGDHYPAAVHRGGLLPVRRRGGTPRHSPAAHVRRPRLDYESHATGLDRNELGALLVSAGLGPPVEHALISLLALNGLRVSEATSASIRALGIERGHRTLTITRKGGKVVTVPLAPAPPGQSIWRLGNEVRADFLTADGRRLDRQAPGGCPPDRPQSRDHQDSRPAHAQACVHYGGAGCGGVAAGRARSRVPRGPADHDEI